MQSTPYAAPDLGALVLHLRAPRPLHVPRHLGRAIYSLGLNLIGRSNPLLASSLHDQQTEKPFAVSALMCGDAPILGNITPSDPVWIRLVGLSADVVSALETYRVVESRRIAEGEEVAAELNYLAWRVIRVEWDQGRLPGLFSYRSLIERNRSAQPTKHLTLRFRTATTFRSLGVNSPLPRADQVFGSLLSRWITFTTLKLRDLPHDQVMAFLQYHLFVSRFDARTELYVFKDGGKEVGFIGDVNFEIVRRSDALGRSSVEAERLIQQHYIWFARTVNLLADFAYYSGVGRKTTWGMGMVR